MHTLLVTSNNVGYSEDRNPWLHIRYKTDIPLSRMCSISATDSFLEANVTRYEPSFSHFCLADDHDACADDISTHFTPVGPVFINL